MQVPRSDPAVVPPQPRGFVPVFGGPWFALAVLFSMNLLNYVDRYAFFAVGKDIQDALAIQDDSKFGVLGAAFMIVYTVVSPLIGWMGDRYNRKLLLASGVGLWSVATIGTAFAHSFSQMFFWRALLGVGEASYGVIAPALLSDLFPPRVRGRVMGLYYLALPLGGGLGYAIGGKVAHVWGWQAAFWVVGLPGLAVAVAGLMLDDPGRGASEGAGPGQNSDRPRLRDYRALVHNRTFLTNTAGMAAVTFATGAYGVWGPTFYRTVRGLNPAQAGEWLGLLTVAAGLIGIPLGSALSDGLRKVTPRAYLLLACGAVLAATPLALGALLDPNRASSFRLLFLAMVLLAAVLGPCNAVTANVVPARQRAAGYALSMFLMHLFGDISSPILIGKLSTGLGSLAPPGSPLERFLTALGAPAVGGKHLIFGMLSVGPVLILGAFFFFIGSRHLAQDQEKTEPQSTQRTQRERRE